MSSEKLRVLIVDDYEPHVDALVDAVCRDPDCSAMGSLRSDEARLKFKDFAPHLLIYDGLMDGMKAWEFGHFILRDMGPDDPRRPYMVALTGFCSTLQRRLCEECGYDEYIGKPIELLTLRDWIAKAKAKAGMLA